MQRHDLASRRDPTHVHQDLPSRADRLRPPPQVPSAPAGQDRGSDPGTKFPARV